MRQQHHHHNHHQQQQQQQSRSSNRKASRDGPAGSEREPLVAVENLVPFCGLVCCMMSLYLTTPDCCGCMTKDIICCCYETSMCCKITRESGFNWICFKCEILNAAAGNCFQCERQCFCLDIRCSVPHFEEGPCLLNVCFLTCCYQYTCLCMRCCASINTLDDALVMKAEQKEKNIEVMRQAMGPDDASSPHPASEFDEADSRSVDSFLEAEDVPQDTVNHRRDMSAVALYALKADNNNNNNTPGKFSGNNPTSKLSGSRSVEVTVDDHAYVTTRHGYSNNNSSSSTDSSSRKTSSKSKNSSNGGVHKNNQQGHHRRNQQQQRRK